MCVRLLATFLVASDLFVLLLYHFYFVCIFVFCVLFSSLFHWSEVDVIVALYTQYFTFSFYFYCVPCVRFHNKIK